MARGENIIQARTVGPAGRVSEFSAERKVILENVPQPPILDIPKLPTKYPIINVSGRAEPGSIITLTIYNENTAETTKVADIRAAAGNSTRVPQTGEYAFYVESGN
ncbi:hypothetical protein TTE2595 [Caldanaerobacter subterraneus subsp. tengcongensis MB4]|uniref:Uncharacterized protein n=1 Tax=Caldanaerobacter subterraneus subsp. tengcongensis (strain DSM 15242 / JCM 11007 / NBRC 100824 / MB4) TaxID=273068 RepID=Q8R729_CALS4|nr:hypothetical protein TTE2595 [Caldanaerobacter subterraneus subsp. tengcongensis MB4]